jgi:hypothetical protein
MKASHRFQLFAALGGLERLLSGDSRRRRKHSTTLGRAAALLGGSAPVVECDGNWTSLVASAVSLAQLAIVSSALPVVSKA